MQAKTSTGNCNHDNKIATRPFTVEPCRAGLAAGRQPVVECHRLCRRRACPFYPKPTRNVTWEDIANDHLTTQDVLQYGMGTNAQRWSPLAQVNDKNVFKLTPAWSYSFGDEKQRGQESQAIVNDGVVYVTGSYSRVFALDAKTGKRLWTYNHRLPDNIRPCCDVVNRGAAIFGDKIYFGTLDARLIALDKNTGKVVWNKNSATTPPATP